MTDQPIENQPFPEAEGQDEQAMIEQGEDQVLAVSQLQEELAECRAKMEEYLDGWQRSRADFANYKKRIERDQAQNAQNATGVIIKRFLEVLDDLERALKNRPRKGDGASFADGIDLIYRKLLAILEAEGVRLMVAADTFDPALHEAISLEESAGHQSGQIIEVIKQGYLLGERVLRPATVRVAK